MKDDLFFDDCGISRTDQLALRQGLKAEKEAKAKEHGEEPDPEEEDDDDAPVKKKPAQKKNAAKTQAKAKAKGKAKARAKGKAKAKDAEASKEAKDAEASKEAPATPADDYDKDMEAELEKQMLGDDKPDALVEAEAASSRPVPKKRASPDDDDQPKPARKRREGPNRTFASRPQPTEVYAKQRYESIRDAYVLHCQPRLRSPSTHQVPKLHKKG